MDECSPEVDNCDSELFFKSWDIPEWLELPDTGFLGLDLLWWAIMLIIAGAILAGAAWRHRHT